MIGIYKVQNLVNNKIYIGQSRDIKERWTAHRSRPFNSNCADYNKPLYQAIRKYGLNNFSFEVIELCSIDKLKERENYWINFFKSYNKEKGYNLLLNSSQNYTTLNEEKAKSIQNELLNSTISQMELSKKYNVPQMAISQINTGKIWIDEKLNYPLRGRKFVAFNEQTKNIKNVKYYSNCYCERCNKKISHGAKMCNECFAISERKVERPFRDELKRLIRIKSFVQIGKMFGVSDNAVRKWCKSYKLPHKKKEINEISDEDWNLI